MQTKTTTRRAVLAGIATAPALAAPALVLAAAPHPDAALFAIERKLAAVDRHAEIAAKAHTQVEEVMIAWRKENPPPVMPPVMRLTGDPGRSFKELARVLDSDDYRAADREYKEAMRAWNTREKAANANCRFDEIEAAYDAVLDEMTSLFEEASRIRAASLDGIMCKARIDHRDDCENGIAASIVDDLLALRAVS